MTDPLRIITSTHTPIAGSKNLEEVAERVCAQLIKPYQIEKLILGLPIHMNGKDSPHSLLVRQLFEILKSKGVQVVLWDERLTSAQSERHFKDMGLSRKERVKVVDSHSAALMLESFLAAHP
jgi:putative Holliday junction resolvase